MLPIDRILLAVWSALILLPSPVVAEIELPGLDEPPIGHRTPLRFGMLLTGEAAVGADAANRRDDGFSLADARLSVRGDLEKGFGYFVNTDLRSTPALLDLEIQWLDEDLGFLIKTGFFRVPVSGELQIAAPALDLIDRSQIVDAVAPGRQIGVEIDQRIAGDALVLRVGAFNGNGLDPNDDNRLLYTLRLAGGVALGEIEAQASSPAKEPWRLHYGASGAYSKGRDARLGLDLPRNFRGSRALGGADVRLSRAGFFLSAEGLYASIDPSALSRRDVFGYQTTIGWYATRSVQLLARYDAFWAGSLASDLAIASVT